MVQGFLYRVELSIQPNIGDMMPGSVQWDTVDAKRFRVITPAGTVSDIATLAGLRSIAGLTSGTATMVAGTVNVPTTAVAASSVIILTVQSLGTVVAPKAIAVTARSNGVQFTVTSADATDTSVVGWVMV